MTNSGFTKYGRETLLHEQLARGYTRTLLTIGFAAKALVIGFLAWLLEFLLFQINFVDWLIERWYVIGIVLAIALAHQRYSIRQRSQILEHLTCQSDPLSAYDGLNASSRFAAGGVEIDRRLFGPVTVSSDYFGVCFWQRGELIAAFGWPRVNQVYISQKSSKTTVAQLTLKSKSGLTSLDVSVPWTHDMGRTIPSDINSNKSAFV